MKIIKAWLVLTNGEQLRVVKKKPYLAPNEVAIEINVKVPQPPRIIGTIDIELPDPPTVLVESTIVEYPDDPVTFGVAFPHGENMGDGELVDQ